MRGLIPSPGHPCFVRATPALSRRSQANDQPASASFPPSARISSSLVGLTSRRLTLHPLSRPLQSHRRGVAQLGSAGALGALGRRFESCRPDHSHSKGSRSFRGPSFLAKKGQCTEFVLGLKRPVLTGLDRCPSTPFLKSKNSSNMTLNLAPPQAATAPHPDFLPGAAMSRAPSRLMAEGGPSGKACFLTDQSENRAGWRG